MRGTGSGDEHRGTSQVGRVPEFRDIDPQASPFERRPQLSDRRSDRSAPRGRIAHQGRYRDGLRVRPPDHSWIAPGIIWLARRPCRSPSLRAQRPEAKKTGRPAGSTDDTSTPWVSPMPVPLACGNDGHAAAPVEQTLLARADHPFAVEEVQKLGGLVRVRQSAGARLKENGQDLQSGRLRGSAQLVDEHGSAEAFWIGSRNGECPPRFECPHVASSSYDNVTTSPREILTASRRLSVGTWTVSTGPLTLQAHSRPLTSDVTETGSPCTGRLTSRSVIGSGAK